MAQGKRGFVDKIDFVTSIGHVSGGASRAELGVKTKGPTKLITDLALFEPDPVTKEMTVTSIHPGVTREQIQDNTGWKVAFAAKVAETPPPTRAGTRSAARTACPHQPCPFRGRVMATRDVFLCDAIRTPIGRYAGALAKGPRRRSCRGADQGADGASPQDRLEPARRGVLRLRHQAGEDNRNVARMALLLAGPARQRSGVTLNRLCASGLDAVGTAARAIRAGEIEFAIAGGVESMTRAPFVQGKAPEAFARSVEIYDTTIGWRFINPLMKQQYGVDSMPDTGENVAEEFQVTRADQDACALRSQQRAGKATASGLLRPGDRGGGNPRAVRARRSRSTGRTSPSRHHAGTAHQAENAVP